MFALLRIYQYLGEIAPKGNEGLYLGYANLPIAIGTIFALLSEAFYLRSSFLKVHQAEISLNAPLM